MHVEGCGKNSDGTCAGYCNCRCHAAAARKIAERELMKLKPSTRAKLLRLFYALGPLNETKVKRLLGEVK